MRLIIGLTISLLVHAFILSLQFGVPGLGIPGLALPWNERRALAPQLNITLANVKNFPEVTAKPVPSESRPESPTVEAIVPSGALRLLQRPSVEAPAAVSPATSSARVKPRPLPKSLRSMQPREIREPAQANSTPQIIAQTEPNPDSFVVPAPEPDEPEQEIAPKIETPKQPAEIGASLAPESALAKPAAEPTVQDQDPLPNAETLAAEQSARIATAVEARKQEETSVKRQAMELEAQKLEEQEADRRARTLAASKLEEATQQEQVRAERQALELEARRRAEEIARQQAAMLARQQQAEQLAAEERAEALANRQKAEAAAAQQRDLERRAAENLQAAAAAAKANAKPEERASLPATLSGSDLASKALAQARKLDISRLEPQPPQKADVAAGNSSRRSIFGSVDTDIGLAMYIESWRLKIERNGRLNYAQSSRDKARGDPVVTVAIRSDGSIEDIVVNRSSGRPELDEAVRRIVKLNARYSAFPPALAHKYDVIEIRRIWNFEDSLRILEEIR